MASPLLGSPWLLEVVHLLIVTVPDFRSGMDTKLETGPGKWELRAHSQSKGATAHKPGKTTSTVKAIPSPTHMLLVKLQQVWVCSSTAI